LLPDARVLGRGRRCRAGDLGSGLAGAGRIRRALGDQTWLCRIATHVCLDALADRAVADRVTGAMLEMQELDIAALERARRGR